MDGVFLCVFGRGQYRCQSSSRAVNVCGVPIGKYQESHLNQTNRFFNFVLDGEY